VRQIAQGLTLPSSGHTTAGHDCSLPLDQRRRCVPLTSNVRRRVKNRRASQQSTFGTSTVSASRSASSMASPRPWANRAKQREQSLSGCPLAELADPASHLSLLWLEQAAYLAWFLARSFPKSVSCASSSARLYGRSGTLRRLLAIVVLANTQDMNTKAATPLPTAVVSTWKCCGTPSPTTLEFTREVRHD
jgi:hypothetical protein